MNTDMVITMVFVALSCGLATAGVFIISNRSDALQKKWRNDILDSNTRLTLLLMDSMRLFGSWKQSAAVGVIYHPVATTSVTTTQTTASNVEVKDEVEV